MQLPVHRTRACERGFRHGQSSPMEGAIARAHPPAQRQSIGPTRACRDHRSPDEPGSQLSPGPGTKPTRPSRAVERVLLDHQSPNLVRDLSQTPTFPLFARDDCAGAIRDRSITCELFPGQARFVAAGGGMVARSSSRLAVSLCQREAQSQRATVPRSRARLPSEILGRIPHFGTTRSSFAHPHPITEPACICDR
jgi:hypothetical protein